MSKEATVMALWMMSAAVCVPYVIMAVVWLRTGFSPYGAAPTSAVVSEVQRRALEGHGTERIADLERFDDAIAKAKAEHLTRLTSQERGEA